MGLGEGRCAGLRGVRVGCAGVLALTLAQCASSDKLSSRVDPKYGVSSSLRVVADGEPVPKGGGTYRVGKPYVVAGRTYYPNEDTRYSAEGLASWYGADFHGRRTANGEVYDMHSISAAHPTMPLPSYARVTNLKNGRSVIVRVNDRGPFHANRLIDLSVKTARLLDFHGDGVARVKVDFVSRAPLEGSDDSVLLATLREGEPAPAPSRIMLASARSFLPSFGDRGAPAVVTAPRGGVPLPPDRPFTLGELQAPADQSSALEMSASSRETRPRRVPAAPKLASAQPAAAPIPAPAGFAPTRGEPAVLSGRGLY